MKAFLRQAWRQSFAVMPFPLVRSLAATAVVAPCYHLVSDTPPLHVRHLYECRSVAAFRAELDLLLRHFRPIALGDLLGAIRTQGRPPAGSLFLSFDDGFREAAEQIAAICLAKGAPATFFLNTGFLDNRALCFRHKASILAERCSQIGGERSAAALRGVDGWTGAREPREFLLAATYQQSDLLDRCARALEVDFEAYLREEKPYLTGAQVEDLLRHGFDIGGHSVDHPLYADLTLTEQLAQTRRCMADLESRFRLGTKAFAFPFVSAGVGPGFYRVILDENTADLIFCLGGQPEDASGRLVERFGVEERRSRPIQALLRAEAGRKSLARAGRWRRASLPQVN